jgi:A/G-specific adenine glycosylase
MTVDISEKQIREFQDTILLWYGLHKRALPWRQTSDPYRILVSEIMSQQTQISRVVPKYEMWIEELPTIESLAKSPSSTVLRLWSGLGYNRRALFLQKAAQAVLEKHAGKFPETIEGLQTLPGIGIYTASAVLCFAFNAQIPVIDTNIRKVIAVHFFAGMLPPEKEVEHVANVLLPRKKAKEWNQALMDYASSELKSYRIPIPKQSKLLGSDRYYRGQTLKYLLQHKNEIVTTDHLLAFFEGKGYPCETRRLELILLRMEKEGFIIQENKQIALPD